MFRSRGENLRSIYILLFLNVAFFLLQYQDAATFARLFAFDRGAVMHGELWRLFTYQFMHAGRVGLINIPPVVTLFLNLVLLTLMGMSVEEDWGTSHFLRFYLIATLTTAGAAAALGVPLLGSYFINFTLLFVYASINRQQTFYLSMILPIRVTWLAMLALAALTIGAISGGKANLAALIGSASAYLYYLSQRVSAPVAAKSGGRQADGTAPGAADGSPKAATPQMIAATKNLTRVVAWKKALAASSSGEIDRLIALSEREIVRGVNICPPVDFKPEHSDRYCVRCDGFAECSARYLRLNRPTPPPPPATPAQNPV
jgi:membrane associated rhomboid family serine protease